MGRSTTPKYYCRVFDTRFINGKPVNYPFDLSYDGKRHGKPSNDKAEKIALAYGKSLEKGGCNEHISLDIGYIPYPNKLYIVRNDGSDKIVAEWVAPAFMVW